MTYPGSDPDSPESAPEPAPASTPTYSFGPAPIPPAAPMSQPAPGPAQPPPFGPTPTATGPTPPGATPPAPLGATPPVPGQPMPVVPGQPMPPTYDPTAAQQFSAPPISAPYGYGGPIPMSGLPMAPPPERRGRGAVITLSILTAVFLLATGVMTTLFLQQRGEAVKANDQVVTLSAQLDDQKSRADELQRTVDNTRRDLDDSKAATEEVTKQKEVIAACVNAIIDYSTAINQSNGRITSKVQKLQDELNDKCDKADKYL